MKVVYLAPASSMHAIRWANSMAEKGIAIFYVTNKIDFIDKLDERVKVRYLKFPKPLGFILNKFVLEKIVREIKPNLVHVHQAAGYAFLASISSIGKTLTSIYGWEVYDLPYKSIFHKKVVERGLSKSNFLASTSNVMKFQTLHVYPNLKHDILVTPFGVDTNKFKKENSNNNSNNNNNNNLTIGIVKKLEDKYGIKYLIIGFNKLLKKGKKDLKLVIIGKGSKEKELKEMVLKFGIEKNVEFIGRIPHSEVSEYLNKFDIYCAPSVLNSESFGVAIVEASACEIPVVVSDVGGLPEVVENGKTGYVVESRNSDILAQKLYELCESKKLREKLGKNGREKVLKEYDWNSNVNEMIKIYEKIRSN